jgi:hypothetical protein
LIFNLNSYTSFVIWNLYFQTNTIDASKTLFWFVLPCLEWDFDMYYAQFRTCIILFKIYGMEALAKISSSVIENWCKSIMKFKK